MRFIITLIIAILPVYVIGLYIYKKDTEKESTKLLRKLFILGMVSCFPAGIIEISIEPLFGTGTRNSNLIALFIYVTLGIAFIEEICKWFIVYKQAYNHDDFNHMYDAIVYCVFVSLGFACLENIFYVFSDSTIWTGLFRAITAIPGHACDAIIMGNYLALAKHNELNNNQNDYKKNLILSIVMPTLIHSIYDYCIYTESFTFLILFVFFLIFIYVMSIKKINKFSKVKENLPNRNSNTHQEAISNVINFCPNCGNKAETTYCPQCGKKLK